MVAHDDPTQSSPSPSDQAPAAEEARQHLCEGNYVGRYRICRLLGQGAFGQVYLAQDEELERPVAVKVPHPYRVAGQSHIDAHLAEARLAARLDHPRIVPVLDCGRTADGRCFFVSNYIEGTSLAARMGQQRIERRAAVELAAGLAEALHHAHLRGVVHRDVKPGNVLLDSTGKAFLTDFGLALGDEEVGADAGVVGTICYMSPEQARGEGHRVDGRSDVFSLCVMLYELLTGQRPFPARTPAEFFEQVATSEPRPPRQLDDTIPKELERICLKGLSKRVADRYSTAKDLAEDLYAFLAEPPAAAAAAPRPAVSAARDNGSLPTLGSDSNCLVPIIPKGLRAYDAEDADFFLELLPGPRDRQGLPESLLFWKRRIESTDPDEAFSVGLMYGPSGCGKTSIVRAGLVPRLAASVCAVYCEADPEATESRLLRRLRFLCPELPADLGLKESLALVRRNPQVAGGRKVLLVLDQFEQWFSAYRGEEPPELVQALRQCDGKSLSCLILVRDDFWLAVSRFLREVEVPLLEGHNSALVDLFDKRHARKVLGAMGRAFGSLPAEPLDRQQLAFLDRAVDGLAEGERVMCVRLALFAEMMRSRPWTPAELRAVGGVTGIGVRFLEETFCGATAPPERRFHENAARAVLESLLPQGESQIKERTRSAAEMLSASGYASRPADFESLLRILDRELRLITPAEPEGQPGEPAPPGDIAGTRTWYQLTHDYLVPSLRQWLREKRSQTIRGRAELCLAERLRRWEAHPETRQLPSWWEWLRIRALTRSAAWSQPQQALMRAARRHYLRRAAMWCTLIVVMTVAGIAAYGHYHAAALVDRLLLSPTASAPDNVRQLRLYYPWARPLLAAAINQETDDTRRLHARLGLLPVDPSQAKFLRDSLLEAPGPEEFQVVLKALEPNGQDLIEGFWRQVGDSSLGTKQRFRAACALAAWAPSDPRWSGHAEEVAAWLVSEGSVPWAEVLRPEAARLAGPLTALYVRSDRRQLRHNAAAVLAAYVRDDVDRLLALGRIAQPADLETLAGPLKDQSRAVAALRSELAQDFPPQADNDEKESLAKKRANAGILLCFLGAAEQVWPYLAKAEDPRLRTCLVHNLAIANVDPALLVARLPSEADASIRTAILWALGQYEASVLTQPRCDALAPLLDAIYRDAPDPGLHGAAEWLLRHWGYSSRIAAADAAPGAGTIQAGRGWYRTAQGHTMAIVRGPLRFQMGSRKDDPDRRAVEPLHEETIGWSFAIGTHEVSLRQYRNFAAGHLSELKDSRSLDSPVGRVSLLEAMAYCRWLTAKEGLPEEAMCYVVEKDGRLQVRPDWLQRPGYRLPTEAEWECACRAGTTTRRYYGHNDEYLAAYAWYLVNRDGALHPCGLLLPNDLGLFDMYGNVAEWCQNRYGQQPQAAYDLRSDDDDLSHVIRGSPDDATPTTLRSAARLNMAATMRFESVGFRIARTMPAAGKKLEP